MTDNVASGGHRVRAAPSLTGAVWGVIEKGYSVYVVKEVDNPDGRWVQLVEFPNENTAGWRPERTVAESSTPLNERECWMLSVKTDDRTHMKTVYLSRAQEKSSNEFLELTAHAYVYPMSH